MHKKKVEKTSDGCANVDQPMGVEVRPRTRQTNSTAFESQAKFIEEIFGLIA